MRKGILVVIIGIIISAMMPFSIYADDYSGSTIQGFNVSLIDVEQVLVQSGGTSGYMGKYIYEVEFILDDSYVGYINISGEIKFYPYNSSTLTTYNLPGRNYFVNGTSFKLTFQLTGDGYTADNRPSLNNTVFTYGNHNLYKHSEIDSLETIINLLTDLYNNTDTIEGLLNNQLTQLQLIADRCNISNQYLQQLTKIKQWNIPYESLNFVINILYYGYELSDYYAQYNYFQFPIFKFDSNHTLIDYYNYYGRTSVPQNKKTFILYIERNIWTQSELSNYFSVTDRYNNAIPSTDYLIDNFSIIQQRLSTGLPYNAGTLIKFDLSNTSGTTQYFYLKYIGPVNDNIFWFPIYSNVSTNKNISTDFALLFGLSNDLLDDLNIIANGTTQSNSAASGLEQNNNQMASDMNSLATIESGYNQDFNSQMQDIDFSNPITNNQGLLPAANFVITVFNGLINNNPLSVLIIVCCILLIGKKVIGK